MYDESVMCEVQFKTLLIACSVHVVVAVVRVTMATGDVLQEYKSMEY